MSGAKRFSVNGSAMRLTDAQSHILSIIWEIYPGMITHREVARRSGLSLRAVYVHVKRLIRNGFIGTTCSKRAIIRPTFKPTGTWIYPDGSSCLVAVVITPKHYRKQRTGSAVGRPLSEALAG